MPLSTESCPCSALRETPRTPESGEGRARLRFQPDEVGPSPGAGGCFHPCVAVSVSVCACVCTCLSVCLHLLLCVSVCACAFSGVSACMSEPTSVCLCVGLRLCLCVSVTASVCACVCAHVCLAACLHLRVSVCVCALAGVYVCVYICVSVCLRLHLYLHVCLCDCICVCVCVHASQGVFCATVRDKVARSRPPLRSRLLVGTVPTPLPSIPQDHRRCTDTLGGGGNTARSARLPPAPKTDALCSAGARGSQDLLLLGGGQTRPG